MSAYAPKLLVGRSPAAIGAVASVLLIGLLANYRRTDQSRITWPRLTPKRICHR